MTSSAPASNATTRSKTLGCAELSRWRSRFFMPRFHDAVARNDRGNRFLQFRVLSSRFWSSVRSSRFRVRNSEPRTPNPGKPLALGAARERVLLGLRAQDDLVGLRRPLQGAADRFLRRAVV